MIVRASGTQSLPGSAMTDARYIESLKDDHSVVLNCPAVTPGKAIPSLMQVRT